MGPLAMLTITEGVITQVGFVIVRFQPAFHLVQRLVACLQNPRQPPARPITAEDVMKVVEGLLHNPQEPPVRPITSEDIMEVVEELLHNPQVPPVRPIAAEDVMEAVEELRSGRGAHISN